MPLKQGEKHNMKNTLDFKAIGDRIKEARIDTGQSQKQLADLVECDQGYISQIEKGGTKPSLAFLAALSNLTGQSIDYLLFGLGVNRRPIRRKPTKQPM